MVIRDMTIYDSMLNSTCARWCNSSILNDLGEAEYTWALHTDNIKCRFSPISLEESKQLSGIYVAAKYKCYILPSQAMSTNDRIKWDGNTYEIIEVKVDSESVTQRLLLKEL